MSSYPNVSVVITFHESEKLIYLLHTLHSIVKHSPAELIQEIIMINDNSSKGKSAFFSLLVLQMPGTCFLGSIVIFRLLMVGLQSNTEREILFFFI